MNKKNRNNWNWQCMEIIEINSSVSTSFFPIIFKLKIKNTTKTENIRSNRVALKTVFLCRKWLYWCFFHRHTTHIVRLLWNNFFFGLFWKNVNFSFTQKIIVQTNQQQRTAYFRRKKKLTKIYSVRTKTFV